MLRSETPAGVVQETYGLLLGHFIIRKLMCEAAATEDIAPRELSFVNTLKILRCRLPEAPQSPRAGAVVRGLARRSRRGATRTAAGSHQPASDQTQNEQLAEETQETPQNTAANEEIRPVYRYVELNGIGASPVV